jgi:sugar phosphate isomerase/epimerase
MMPTLAVSSWSLHDTLGPIYPGLALVEGSRTPDSRYGATGVVLLDLPAALAAHGLRQLEVCHFHFPRTDAAYLGELRARLDAAGVALTTVLVDEGDITAADPARRARDLELIAGWIDVAATVGARRVRVVAGEAAPGEVGAIDRSVAGLAALLEHGRSRGVAVITENWRRLGDDPASLLAILDGLDGQVGLCADFGNIPAPQRADTLRQLLPHADTVHAKGDYLPSGALDEADFGSSLDLARAAGFSGEYVLIFSNGGDEWGGLARLAEVVEPYL